MYRHRYVMNSLFTLLLLCVTLGVSAQNSSYYVTNNSPKTGALSQAYTVSVSVEASPANGGSSVTLTSETYSIAPGATQQFLFTVPQGYALKTGTTVFRVATGSCSPMTFSTGADRVRGNAAGCFGIYHITDWSATDIFHYTVTASMIPGGL